MEFSKWLENRMAEPKHSDLALLWRGVFRPKDYKRIADRKDRRTAYRWQKRMHRIRKLRDVATYKPFNMQTELKYSSDDFQKEFLCEWL